MELNMNNEKKVGKEIVLNINGMDERVFCQPGETLLQVLRNKLYHTEVKEGCGKGDCGACTVLLNGIPVDSCLVLAYQGAGKKITTVKGLGSGDKLHPLQKQFIAKGAIQCGFCIPGQLLSAKALLEKKFRPSREEIKKAISGNLCRCTGYKKIVDAIEEAALKIRKQQAEGR
jgi:carbon-monoxide dehydrogenase small subunit